MENNALEAVKEGYEILNKTNDELVEWANQQQAEKGRPPLQSRAEAYAYTLGYIKACLRAALVVNNDREKQVQVGQNVKVPWSNGGGYSIYRVSDDPGSGPHRFNLVTEVELPYNQKKCDCGSEWDRTSQGGPDIGEHTPNCSSRG